VADANTVAKYDSINNATNYFDSTGKFAGSKSGDTRNDPKVTVIPSTSHSDALLADTNPNALMRDLLSDVVPAATTMLTPEFKAMGPIKNILARMGIGAGLGTGFDQLLNIGQGKPVINSAVDAGTNSILGSLPELGSQMLGMKMLPRTSRSITTSEPTISEMVNNRLTNSSSTRSGTGSTTSSGTSSSEGTTAGNFNSMTEGQNGLPIVGTQEVPNKLERDAAGRFLPGFKPGTHTEQLTLPGFASNSQTEGERSGTSSRNSQYQSQADMVNEAIANATSKSQGGSTTTTQPGVKTTVTEGPHPGMLGNIMDLMRSIQPGAAPMNKGKAAALGFALNSLFDSTVNKPTQSQ
jgi:hypothetical protein